VVAFCFALFRFSADFEGNTQQSSGEQQSTTTKTTTHKQINTTIKRGGSMFYFARVSFAFASLLVLLVVLVGFCALSVTTINNQLQEQWTTINNKNIESNNKNNSQGVREVRFLFVYPWFFWVVLSCLDFVFVLGGSQQSTTSYDNRQQQSTT
jgi:hypothetical protein